jgi:haloalkane dehalogenase
MTTDWGSVLGFNWAYHHQDRIAGLVFSEFLRPFPEFLPGFEIFRAFRDPEMGPKLLILENAFIEKVLPAGIVRGLTQVEHDYYRGPFLKEEDRQPIYRFPNEIPIEGQPADVWRIVETYHEWLLESGLPKLFFWAEPGKIVSVEMAKWYMERLKNVKGVNVGAGIHDIQEDQPHKMGSEIVGWLDEVEI